MSAWEISGIDYLLFRDLFSQNKTKQKQPKKSLRIQLTFCQLTRTEKKKKKSQFGQLSFSELCVTINNYVYLPKSKPLFSWRYFTPVFWSDVYFDKCWLYIYILYGLSSLHIGQVQICYSLLMWSIVQVLRSTAENLDELLVEESSLHLYFF